MSSVANYDIHDRYIRRVKGGKYQARPYDSIDGKRYNLGLFPSRYEARKAIQLFWRGKLKELPRFVRRIKNRDGTIEYTVYINHEGEWIPSKCNFPTVEDAVAWRDDYVRKHYNMFAQLILVGREAYRREQG